MALKKLPALRPLFLGIGSILLIILLAGGLSLAFALHGSPRAFAASLQRVTGNTCAQAPTMENCNNQDPERQGCAADAVTLGLPMNVSENGFTIGGIERRWSARCQSWWGRVFDNRLGLHAMYITVAGTTFSGPPTFISTNYRILYSSMVFDAAPTQQVPAITGTLEIDGITTAPSATLPSISVPGTRQ